MVPGGRTFAVDSLGLCVPLFMVLSHPTKALIGLGSEEFVGQVKAGRVPEWELWSGGEQRAAAHVQVTLRGMTGPKDTQHKILLSSDDHCNSLLLSLLLMLWLICECALCEAVSLFDSML